MPASVWTSEPPWGKYVQSLWVMRWWVAECSRPELQALPSLQPLLQVELCPTKKALTPQDL